HRNVRVPDVERGAEIGLELVHRDRKHVLVHRRHAHDRGSARVDPSLTSDRDDEAMQESTDISFRPVQPSDADFVYEMFVASRERELAPLPSPMRDVLARQQYDVYRRGMG